MTKLPERLRKYLSNLEPEHVVGSGGLAVLCAASLLAYDPGTLPLAAWLGNLGLNVLAGVLQGAYQGLRDEPGTQDVARLAQHLQAELVTQPQLRAEIGTLLTQEEVDALAIAESVARGDPATHGWLLLAIYADVNAHRTDLDDMRLSQTHIEETLAALQTDLAQRLANIRQAVADSENRTASLLSPEQIADMLAPLHAQEMALQQLLAQSGAIASGEGAIAIGQQGIMAGTIGGDAVSGVKQENIVIAESGAMVYIGEAPVKMDAVARKSTLGRYLRHLIAHNRYLRLQGLRSGGRLINIELEHIYITLRARQRRTVIDEERWLAEEAALAPGESRRHGQSRATVTETVTVSVNSALADQRRLVVLGDPGSGKTTLLRYLTLLYARSLAEGQNLVQTKLGLAENGLLPILMPLRRLARFLQQADESGDGHILLLEFLQRSLKSERIDVPLDFFDAYLQRGHAIILLDGMDEVAGSDLRRRVARLVEAFTCAYPDCRYVVTSRIVGYSGAARLGEAYATSTVRDFTLQDVQKFLSHWHRLVAIGQMEPGPTAEAYAAAQTDQLMTAIRDKQQIRDLAINPLMLTVIALVHRDRVKLPDRRAELYAEAVDVLLGKWDEARGVTEPSILGDKPFDTGDKRLLLQLLALHMHERELKEIDTADLQALLLNQFRPMVVDDRAAERAQARFMQVIEARTGLLVARGEGVYAFSHLTFQEYLAALAVAARDDYVDYTLARTADSWWRELILLEAGYLSTQSRERTTRLVKAIADSREEPEPYHNLVLAAECLQDVGSSRVEGELEKDVQRRLRSGVEAPPPSALTRVFSRVSVPQWIERRSAAMQALVRTGAGFWSEPYGEPEWIEIPAGEFTMGEKGALRTVQVAAFTIARVPITNAQYHLFVHATDREPPGYWEEGRPPKGLESHPVVNVTWHDALAYCAWLSDMTGKEIALPAVEQWEKAARGDQDARDYPWGDTFDKLRCNTSELGIDTTTPVGIFPDGASPYGVLDMSGNVWEWTQTESSPGRYWLRGGSWYFPAFSARVAARISYYPDLSSYYLGFRVAAPVISGF